MFGKTEFFYTSLSQSKQNDVVEPRCVCQICQLTFVSYIFLQCFSAADVFEEAGIEPQKEAEVADIERLSSIVIANILHGYCIGESKLISPDEFIRSVFEDYGTFGTILKPGKVNENKTCYSTKKT